MDYSLAIWGVLNDIRFLLGMISLFVVFTFVTILAHVARHWNDMYEEDGDDDAVPGTVNRS